MFRDSLGRKASPCAVVALQDKTLPPLFLSLSWLLLLSMASHGIDDPFGHFGSAVLHPLPAPCPPQPSDLWGRGWEKTALMLCSTAQRQPRQPCVTNTVLATHTEHNPLRMDEHADSTWLKVKPKLKTDMALLCRNHIIQSDLRVKWVNGPVLWYRGLGETLL